MFCALCNVLWSTYNFGMASVMMLVGGSLSQARMKQYNWLCVAPSVSAGVLTVVVRVPV